MILPSTSVRPGRWSTTSAGETFDLGQKLGQQLRGGELILLDGPLGAGKTVFVKGVTAALDVDTDEVTSPSFTLVNQYDGTLKVFHVDLYRLDNGPSAAHAVDLEELLTDEHAVVIIEWAERLHGYPLPKALRIQITGDGEESRTISLVTES